MLGNSADSPQRENLLAFRCLLFFTFVLFIAPQEFFPVLEPLHLAKVSAGLAAIAYIVDRLGHARPLTIMTPEVRSVLWLVLLAVISIPHSSWPGGSMDFLFSNFLKGIVIFLLLANLMQTARQMKLVMGSVIVWGVIVSVKALVDYRMGIWKVGAERIPGYTSGLTSDPNDLALTLNLILPLTMGLYFALTRSLPRLLLLAAMALLAAAVIASFSRGGFLALLAVLAAVAFRQLRRRGLVALGPLLALVLLAVLFLPSGYGERLYSIYDTSADPNGSADARWAGLVLGFQLMLENPLLGLGLNMHPLSFPERGLGWQGVHNAFLQIGADLGVPAFLVFVLLIWQLFKAIRHSRTLLRRTPEDREALALATGIETALVAYVVGASLLPVAYNFHLYYIAGFAVALKQIANRRRSAIADLGERK